MALTFSNPFKIGNLAPDFTLPDVVSGHDASLLQLKGELVTVIMFICNHCPYVVHLKDELVRIANEFASEKISFIAISSNDAQAYPEDKPELMRKDAMKHNYPFPYLYDESQEIAKAYHAACTPDFFVFDAELKCTYHGRFDESSPKNQKPVTGSELKEAIHKTAHDIPIPIEGQKPSSGCNIKWKTGVDPFI